MAAGHPLPRRRLISGGALTLVVASVAVTTGGCTSDPGADPGPTDPEVDAGVRSQAIAGERQLIAAYDATVERHPALADRLAPLRAQHEEHLRVLLVGATDADVAEGSPDGDPAEAASPAGDPAAPGGTTPAVPSSSATAVRALRRAERAAAKARAADCVAATGADLARVLALVSASEASHAAALGDAS